MHQGKNRPPHGRWIRCASGYRAYVPDPLPPPIEWSSSLASGLSAADRAVGQPAGEWEEWLSQVLAGLAGQAEDAPDRIRRIDALLASRREKLARIPSRLPGKSIELSAENPYWTVNKLAARLGVAFTTAQRSIDRLGAAGIVTLSGDARRNRVYCARSVLEILEEPPRIAGGPTNHRRGWRP